MARNLGFLIFALLMVAVSCESAGYKPISESHQSVALELFSSVHESFLSLKGTYMALKTFDVIGIEKKHDITTSLCGKFAMYLTTSTTSLEKTYDALKKFDVLRVISSCAIVVDTLQSSSSTLKDVFDALRVNSILKCELDSEAFRGAGSRLKGYLDNANSLTDFYYSIRGLVFLKDQMSEVDVNLGDADRVFRSIKALGHPESNYSAAGNALEALAGVISLASSHIDNFLISTLKDDILKLFDGIERHDDGTYYFHDNVDGARGLQSTLSGSASVVRGITAVAGVISENLNLPKEKVLGLAKFLLSVGIPGNAEDLFHQIDALNCLENIRGSTPLIWSMPATVISLTKKDQLKDANLGERTHCHFFSWVRVCTVLGSLPPTLSVRVMQIIVSGSKDAPVINQRLKFDAESGVHVLETLPEGIDVGSYIFSFEFIFNDPEHEKNYFTERSSVPIHITGVIKIGNAEIAILGSDHGCVEAQKKLNLPGDNAVALSANHLKKLRLSFDLTTPSGNAFEPHQAFLELRHESGIEHIFLVGNSGKQFEIMLDFSGLVEKFFYLSGKYDIQLTIGDSVMENAFLHPLGHVELDLPHAPEKAALPPRQPVDPYSGYGRKAEISHKFKGPEKPPYIDVCLGYMELVLLPFFGFVAGLYRLGANLDNFPNTTVPSVFATLFHMGIAAVLALYVQFFFKLNLFTTLKALGLLGMFLIFVGDKTLPYLASRRMLLESDNPDLESFKLLRSKRSQFKIQLCLLGDRPITIRNYTYCFLDTFLIFCMDKGI